MIDLHDDLAAALADRYQVERELGRGGMAVVYLARDVKHSRHVAVKVLRPDLASSIGAERFLREIDVAARLTHPNILTLHDSGSAEGGALLYYVMPWVEGETLRARLDREHQLPVDEALAITRQVAAALDYAHARGVVHRDVKPENILLTGEHACVADFGLARALYVASSRRLTESAVAVGTPAYMSPEQAAADPDVDGRADVYSLGCVVFEMLAGTAPYRGATAQAVLAQHLTAPVPSICAQRPHCPAAVDAAVQRAMEKIPADRFRTAGEMVKAMAATAPGGVGAPPPRNSRASALRRRARSLTAGAACIAALAALGLGIHRWSAAPAALEPDLYAVVQLHDAAAGRDRALTQQLLDALSEWKDVRVIDSPEIDAGRDSSGNGAVTHALARARSRHAGRLVLVDRARIGDSVRLRLASYDVSDGRTLGEAKVTVAPTATLATQQSRVLVNALLREGGELPWKNASDAARPSLSAWRAYDGARAALRSWDLVTALAMLQDAVKRDPDLPQAQLWLARVQMWSGQLTDSWRAAARRAYDLRGRLPPVDSLGAEAQLALATGRFPEACARYREAIARDSSSVAAWYGLGECQSRDETVVPDARSPSGYAFRGSMHAAAQAYLHIVDESEVPRPAFVYRRLSEVLVTAGNRLRPGHLEGATPTFRAYPTLQAETTAYVPYPTAQAFASARVGRGKAAALDRNRSMLRRLYLGWAQESPASADAHVALAGLLEATEQLTGSGDDALSALDQIARARALLGDSTRRLELANTELRLLVKSGRWRDAFRLADSLLAAIPASARDSTAALAGAAALTGRVGALSVLLDARDGSALSRVMLPNGAPVELPSPVQRDIAVLSAFAYTGACDDSVRALPDRVERRLRNYVGDDSARIATRDYLLRIPFVLGAPCLGGAPLLALDPGRNHTVLMARALFRAEAGVVRDEYAQLLAIRIHDRPGDIPIDGTFIESWILAAAGDTTDAIAHLDGSLDALPTLGTYLLDQPSQSAALVRAMALRAELAAARGDRATAARWADAVTILWGRADPELRPYVARIAALRKGIG